MDHDGASDPLAQVRRSDRFQALAVILIAFVAPNRIQFSDRNLERYWSVIVDPASGTIDSFTDLRRLCIRLTVRLLISSDFIEPSDTYSGAIDVDRRRLAR